MIILYLLIDLKSVFFKYFLNVLDKDISLIVSVYHTLLAYITEFNSTLQNIVSNSNSEDVNENAIAKIGASCNQSKHPITLNSF